MQKSGRLHQKLQKLEHRFRIIVNICAIMVIKIFKKTKTLCFLLIYWVAQKEKYSSLIS